MPFSEHPLGILLVPPGSAARELLVSASARVGMRVAEEPAHAALALADLTHPEGLSALRALRATATGSRLSLLALVPAGEDSFHQLESLHPGEVMLAGAQPGELAYRLRLMAQRYQQREDYVRRQRDLALLLELTAEYAESLDIEALLHDVTRKLAGRLGIARAALVMLDADGSTGHIIAASDDPTLKDLRIELTRYPEIREVVRTARPVVVEDTTNHPLLEGVQGTIAARGIHSVAALPLPIRGQVRGVLLLRASGERPAFSPQEIDFLTTVAHATAVALRNASLLETVRGQTETERTARLVAEAKAASLETYHLFFANVREGVAILDERACVLSLNPAGCSVLDTTAESAYGRHLNELTQPVDEGVLMDLVAAARSGQPRSDVDVVVRTLAGRRLTLSISAAPLVDSGAALILSFRDVTLARKLADELRQTKEFLERLIDSSVDGIIAADMEGRVILFNKGAESLCGYTSQEALSGLSLRQLYRPGVADQLLEQLRSPEHGGRGRLSVCRQELIHRSGELVPVNMTASILYEGGRELATVGIYTDLRDRVQLERKLSDVETRLEQSEKNAVIVALAGTAAHELNQPLTSIMGYAELLKRRLKEEDVAFKPVDIIYREAERMAEIVRKIGKITRYETKAYLGSQQILDLDKASSHDE